MRPPTRTTPRLERLGDRIAPATFTVTNANDAGTGSLRQAVLNANSASGADLIDFSAFFNTPRTITLASEIAITGAVTIDGPSAANVTVSGNDFVGLFNTQAAAAGTAIGFVDLTLRQGRITGTAVGGAIAAGDEAIAATRCVFTQNFSNSGGGAIGLFGDGSLTATDCTLTGNIAGSQGGGAVLSRTAGSNVVLRRCDISANTADSFNPLSGGGGVNVFGGFLLEDSTVSGNIASSVVGDYSASFGYGGGLIVINGSVATIRNSTISGNRAGRDSFNNAANGGGIYIHLGALVVQNSTIVGNRAPFGGGGGIWGETVSLESCVVAGNAAGFAADVRAAAVNARTSSIVSRSGITTFNDQGGNRPAGENPRLGPLQNNGGPTRTHLLLPGSPCVNAGSNPANLTTDQRGTGFPRVLNGTADMGAAEGVDVNPTATAAGLPAAVTAAGGTSYTVVVRYDDDIGIDPATLDLGDIAVTGPGYATPQSPTARTVVGSGTVVTVTYSFSAPGGAFDFADDGLYTIAMAANQVRDLDAPVGHSVAAGLLGSFRVAAPGTLVVDEPTDIDDGNVTAGHLSLREAVRITNAADGTADTITFSPTVFNAPRTIAMTGELLAVRDSLAIVGPGAGLLTLSSAGPHPTIYVFMSSPGNAASLSGLTVTNSATGGISSNAALTLTGIVVTNCQGSGVYVNGPLTMRDCTVSNNQIAAGDGGGVYVSTNGGSVVLERSSFINNRAGATGGGLFVSINGLLQISECTISGNQANTAVQSNGHGGGGAFLTAALSSGSFIRNSTISGNVVAGGGGASGGGLRLYFYGTLAIANSTITGNSTTGPGGGIAVFPGYFSGFDTLSLNSTVIAGNSAGTATGGGPDLYFNADLPVSVPGSNNLVGVANSGNVTLTGTGNRTGTVAAPLNPLLGPLANNGGPTRTHALLPGSPALNAGNNAAGLTTDQRGTGFVRVSGAAADIGAFEVQPSTVRVQGVAVNGGAAQRSRVTSLTVTFTAPVSFAGAVADAFALSRVGGGAVGSFTAVANVVNGVTVVTLSGFTGAEAQFGSLADGRYAVTVRASQVAGLDGNGDGTGGDDYVLAGTVANGLYRLFGDANADGVVNAFDFGQMRAAFGSTAGQAAYVDWLDLNGDGTINAFDFGHVRNRFGGSVP